MKKILVCLFIMIMVILLDKVVYSYEDNIVVDSQIVELRKRNIDELENYKEKYGNDLYGFVAYILNKVRIYSIPLCFLGFCIVQIHYVIGIRHMETLARALPLKVTFTTILIICQILPLAFALVIKLYLN